MAEYAIVPNIDAPELTVTDLAVWAALCRFAQWELVDGKPVKSRPGTCFPSLTGLQQAAHCSRATICRTLQKLEKIGYIARTQGDNAHGNTKYTLFPNRQGGSLTQRPGSLTQRLGGSHSETRVVSQRDGGSLTVRHEQTNITNPYNKPMEQEAEGKAAAADEPDRVSLGQATKLWNDRLGPLGFPTVMKETPARKRAFQARVNEASERRTLAWWKGLISRVEGAEFLRDSAQQKAGWLNFDWLLRENNLVKVLEGRYDDRREAPQPKGQPRTGMSMEEYLAYIQKDPFFGGGEEDMSDGRGEQAGNDGAIGLSEGGGGPVWAASAEPRGSKSLCPAVAGF